MYRELFSDFDKINAPQEIVNKAVRCVTNTNREDNIIEYKRNSRKIALSALSACLVAVFIGTMVLCWGNLSSTEIKQKRGFVITANAQQVHSLGDLVDDTVIGVFSGEFSGGWAMYQNYEKFSEKTPTYFQSYCLNHFSIEGENIKTVTFKTNKEGTYFAISPEGYYSDSIDMKKKSGFTDLSLDNSKYSAEELAKYQDGLSYGELYCDTFTYNNTEESDCINLSSMLEFVVEGNESDPKQLQLLDRIWLFEEELTKEKDNYEPSSEKINNLYLELSDETFALQEKVLDNAELEVMIVFSDGSVQTKILKVGLVETDNENWLTISE